MSSKNAKKVWINGLSGRMGKALEEVLKERSDLELIGGASKEDFSEQSKMLTRADVVIDFSSQEGSKVLAEFVKKNELTAKSFLVCSTGLSRETKELWKEIAEKKKNAVLMAPNTSLGIFMTLQTSLLAAPIAKSEGFDILIHETHHRYKKDSPSGTALFLGEALSKKTGLKLATDSKPSDPQSVICIQASRGGGVFGEHTIRFISDDEEVSITHRAFSRALFAKGAAYLALALTQKSPRFYELESFLSR